MNVEAVETKKKYACNKEFISQRLFLCFMVVEYDLCSNVPLLEIEQCRKPSSLGQLSIRV